MYWEHEQKKITRIPFNIIFLANSEGYRAKFCENHKSKTRRNKRGNKYRYPFPITRQRLSSAKKSVNLRSPTAVFADAIWLAVADWLNSTTLLPPLASPALPELVKVVSTTDWGLGRFTLPHPSPAVFWRLWTIGRAAPEKLWNYESLN